MRLKQIFILHYGTDAGVNGAPLSKPRQPPEVGWATREDPRQPLRAHRWDKAVRKNLRTARAHLQDVIAAEVTVPRRLLETPSAKRPARVLREPGENSTLGMRNNEKRAGVRVRVRVRHAQQWGVGDAEHTPRLEIHYSNEGKKLSLGGSEVLLNRG